MSSIPSGTDSYGHRYLDIEWRFTGSRSEFYGMDPLTILFFPLLFFGLAQGFGWFFFIGLIMLLALAVYVSFLTPYKSLILWSRAMRTKHLQRCKWPISE